MRAVIHDRGDLIEKRVAITEAVANSVKLSLVQYIEWLEKVGFFVPKTELIYQKYQMVFLQEKIVADKLVDFKVVLVRLSRLRFVKYGIDAHPNNFLASNGRVYFVDFYPFLLNDAVVLQRQFNYSVPEVRRRYFSPDNISAFCTVRLFLENKDYAYLILKYAMRKNFFRLERVLPRERCRLLAALRL